MGRGAVVVILSDGWDRGEPDLGKELARFRQIVGDRLALHLDRKEEVA